MTGGGPPAPADLSLIEKAALLSGADVWRTRGNPRLGIPQIWLSDGPHGIRKQPGDADHLGIGDAQPAVCFPTGITLANTWDESLLDRIGAALGDAATAAGVDVLLGPGLNIVRSPLGGRAFEYLGEDPELAGRLAAAFVRGVQSRGVAATPKHFAANSQERRRMVSDSVLDERTLREMYLTAFEIVVREAAPWALMSSYNLVNGVHAHEHAGLLIDILREEWDFDGVVVSDWGGTSDPVAAVAAGGTLEMPSPGFSSVRAIVDAVATGRLVEADVDARVGEMLRLVERVTRPRPAARLSLDAQHALAREAAAAGTVLLRNRDDILPLRPDARIALIGAAAAEPRYQGAGSSVVTPTRLTSLVGSAGASGVQLIGHAPGYAFRGAADAAMIAEAVGLAEAADVVVLALAVPPEHESEGRDRPHLRLPDAQTALLAALARTRRPIVAVVAGGGPVEMPWREQTAALVHGFLGGQAGAEAMWDVLTGRSVPGGRLAVTVPERLEDGAPGAAFPSEDRTAVYREGVLVGYRHHATGGPPPAFPFGFGLGYTTVTYDALDVTAAGASVVVRNAGHRAAVETVQLYVHRAAASRVHRAERELKGFARIALEPGEQAQVWIPFGERTFRFWDAASHTWQVESGMYDVLVGPSSGDLPLRGSVDVVGTVPAPQAALGGSYDPVSLLDDPLPRSEWNGPPFGADTPIDALRRSPSVIARSIPRIVERRMRRADRAGRPDLNAVFLSSAPLRIIHQLTGGRAGPAVTAGVVALANGRSMRGLAAVVRAMVRHRRAERRTRRAVEEASR